MNTLIRVKMQVTEVAGNSAGGLKITAKAIPTSEARFNQPRSAHLYPATGTIELNLDTAPSPSLRKDQEIFVVVEGIDAPAAAQPTGAVQDGRTHPIGTVTRTEAERDQDRRENAARSTPSGTTLSAREQRDYQDGLTHRRAGRPLPANANDHVRRGYEAREPGNSPPFDAGDPHASAPSADYNAGVALKQANKMLPDTANAEVRRGYADASRVK